MGRLPKPVDDAALFQPSLASLDRTIAWLADHGLSTKDLVVKFHTSPNHIRQLVSRGRHPLRKEPLSPRWVDALHESGPFNPLSREDRRALGVRPEPDSVELNHRQQTRLVDLEEEAERLVADRWNLVRFGSGASRIREVLARIRYPNYHRRVRVKAQLHQLLCEISIHSGQSATSLQEGIKSLHLSRIAYSDSDSCDDLIQIARTARLLSQAHLLRNEPDQALPYLWIHEGASLAAGVSVNPEHYHQMAGVAFQFADSHSDVFARKMYAEAMLALADAAEDGVPIKDHEIADIGSRQRNLLDANWDAAQELHVYMMNSLAPDDIHRSISVNWTVACAYQTDATLVQQQAHQLLLDHRRDSEGFGHQVTVARLLELTPELPSGIRAPYARMVLYQNALKDS
jgi:hypothetical protein